MKSEMAPGPYLLLGYVLLGRWGGNQILETKEKGYQLYHDFLCKNIGIKLNFA